MRTQGLSSTIALSGNVDLESAKKGMVSPVSGPRVRMCN